jgi:hypothetical protein
MPEMQRPSPPVSLGPSPRRHHQRPSAAAWCTKLLACFLCLPTWSADAARRSKIRQPGPKSADALSPKRTGPCKCYPRRYHVLRPSLPLSVTWTFGHLGIRHGFICCPVLYTPASWSLQPLHASSKITTRCRVVPTPRPRYHTPFNILILVRPNTHYPPE